MTGAPKFPSIPSVKLLWRAYLRTGTPQFAQIVMTSLDSMSRGGIYDHVGGGFSRYAVDERWIVPHFEKMAYDNSELLRAYLDGWSAFGTDLYRDVAAGIVSWVREVLAQGPGTRGGDGAAAAFFTSQDADVSFGDDGDYWTWTRAEAQAALDPAEFEVAQSVLDIAEAGEMHHNPAKNVLWYRRLPATDAERETLRAALTGLKAARDARPAPFVDTTAYVNWNAMMAGAFLQAGALLDQPECNALALRVLERIWEETWDEGTGLGHVVARGEPRGLLDDNAQSAAAFLDAYEATGDERWLERATRVADYCRREHWDDDAGGYWDVARNRGGPAYLAHRAKPVQDSPTPSPNGVMALVQARLWAVSDDPERRRVLDRQLAAFAGAGPELGLYGATLLRALDWALHPVTRIEISGPLGPGPACDMHLLALRTYRPRRIVIRRSAERTAATVCVGTTCSLPVATAAELRALLA
jgi:hypothetical protein